MHMAHSTSNNVLPVSRFCCYNVPSRLAALLVVLLSVTTYLYLLLHLSHLSSRLSSLSTSLYDSPHSIPTPTPLSLPLLLSLLSLARSYSVIGLVSSCLGLSGILRKPFPTPPRTPSSTSVPPQATAPAANANAKKQPAVVTHLQYFATWLSFDTFVHATILAVIALTTVASWSAADPDADGDGSSSLGSKLAEGLCSSVEELGEFWETATSSTAATPHGATSSSSSRGVPWIRSPSTIDVEPESRALVWTIAATVLGFTGWEGQNLWEDCEDRFRALVRGVVLFLILSTSVRIWFGKIVRDWLDNVRRAISLVPGSAPMPAVDMLATPGELKGIGRGYGSGYGRCGGSSRRKGRMSLKNWGGCGLDDVPEEDEDAMGGLGLDMGFGGVGQGQSSRRRDLMLGRPGISVTGGVIGESSEDMERLEESDEDAYAAKSRSSREKQPERLQPMAYPFFPPKSQPQHEPSAPQHASPAYPNGWTR